MLEWLKNLWEAGSSGVQGTLNMLVWAVVLAGAILGVVLLMVIWTWWNTMPEFQKKLAKTLIVGIIVVYCFATGWVFAPYLRHFGLPSTWGEVQAAALDAWMRWDGFTRSHRWVGLLLLALLPALVWPHESDETQRIGDGQN